MIRHNGISLGLSISHYFHPRLHQNPSPPALIHAMSGSAEALKHKNVPDQFPLPHPFKVDLGFRFPLFSAQCEDHYCHSLILGVQMTV